MFPRQLRIVKSVQMRSSFSETREFISNSYYIFMKWNTIPILSSRHIYSPQQSPPWPPADSRPRGAWRRRPPAPGAPPAWRRRAATPRRAPAPPPGSPARTAAAASGTPSSGCPGWTAGLCPGSRRRELLPVGTILERLIVDLETEGCCVWGYKLLWRKSFWKFFFAQNFTN